MLPEEWAGASRPLLLLLAALAIDAAAAAIPMLARALPHPRRAVHALAADLERRLNREKRSRKARLVRGLLVVAMLAGAAAALGWAAMWGSQRLTNGWILEIAVIALLCGQRTVFRAPRAVGAALTSSGFVRARAILGRDSGRDLSHADAYAVTRAAIEAAAEGFADRVVAPVFWYLLLGLPGLAAQTAINATAAVIGLSQRRYESFGLVARRLDDAVGAIPARLAALILAAAALFTPGAGPLRALAVAWRSAGKHPFFNAGWPVAAMAGALGLALAGPGTRFAARAPWIGTGSARPSPPEIRRALYLVAIACLIVAVLVMLAVPLLAAH